MNKLNYLKTIVFATPFLFSSLGLFAKSGTNNPDSLATKANTEVDTSRNNLKILNSETKVPHIFSHQEALEILQSASQNSGVVLEIRSSGGCDDKENPACTSLDGIRESTLKGVSELLKELNLNGINAVIITGATETGHSRKGDHTHFNGYKVDFALDPKLNTHVEGKWKYIGVREDGAKMYRNEKGTILGAREKDHWDMTFLPNKDGESTTMLYETFANSDTITRPSSTIDTLTAQADSLYQRHLKNNYFLTDEGNPLVREATEIKSILTGYEKAKTSDPEHVVIMGKLRKRLGEIIMNLSPVEANEIFRTQEKNSLVAQ